MSSEMNYKLGYHAQEEKSSIERLRAELRTQIGQMLSQKRVKTLKEGMRRRFVAQGVSKCVRHRRGDVGGAYQAARGAVKGSCLAIEGSQ